MTISYNSTTDAITITSTLLADFGTISSVALTGGINCPDTLPFSDTIVEGDVTSNTFTVSKSDFFESTEDLADGVYTFVLKVTSTSNVITTKVGCLFIDNETKCDVAKIANGDCDTLELKVNYYLLSNAGQGDCECDCEPLCALYKYISEYESDSCGGCTGC